MSVFTPVRPPYAQGGLPVGGPAGLGSGPSARPAGSNPGPVNWIQYFIVFQTVCQLLLLTPAAAGPLRAGFRIAAFGISLVFLFALPGKGKPHPAAKGAVAIVAFMAMALFNTEGDSLIAGVAQIALNLAILGPVFWAPRLDIDRRAFRAILFTIWGFYTLSATFGVLQVYFPGRFTPRVSELVAARGTGYLRDLTISVTGGERILRPMGLTDTPGGAANAGFYTVLLGMAFLLTERRFLLRSLFVASMMIGMLCLYLCQVRSLVVVLSICIVTFIGVLFLRGARAQLALLAGVMGPVIVLSFFWAASVGGAGFSKRLEQLTEGGGQNFYRSRGIFFESTISDLLPRYPLGAGLGRWGMTYSYFGDHSRPMIWAEIQWTGWLLDGGVPLILAYLAAIGIAMWVTYGVFLRRDAGDFWIWAAVIIAYDFGAFAITFSYPYFVSQNGLEFWMLNSALFAASRSVLSDGVWVRRWVRADTAASAVPIPGSVPGSYPAPAPYRFPDARPYRSR